MPSDQVVVGEIPGHRTGFQPRPVLLTRLSRRREGPPAIVLTGTWGVGKTQLAAEYARARLAGGWRLIAWVNARDSESLLAGLAAVAEAAGLSYGGSGQGTVDPGQAVRRSLEADGSRCLLVFDDAEDPGLLEPFLPSTGAAQVLISTALEAVPELGETFQIEVFSADEAQALLAGRTGLADDAGASAVAAGLGYLPLALDQAAAVIAGQHLGYAEYLAQLQALPVGDYLVRGEDAEEQPYPPGVAEAVLLSLEAAWAADPIGVCAGVMETLAVLSPAVVRRDLLSAAGQAGALLGRGRRIAAAMVEQALEQLNERSLLCFGLDGQAVTVHGLVAQVVRGALARRGRLAAACGAAASALEIYAETILNPRDRVAVREMLGQVTALLENAGAHPDDPDLARMLLRLRSVALHHQIELGDSMPHAIAIGEELIADLERVLGPDHPDKLSAQDSLAAAFQAAGRAADAIPLLEHILVAQQRVLGPKHPDTLTSQSNLAGAYRDVGRFAEAILLFKLTLAAREGLLGADDPSTLKSRGNLAAAYRAAGRIAEAIPLFEQTLDGRELVLGAGQPDVDAGPDNLAADEPKPVRLDPTAEEPKTIRLDLAAEKTVRLDKTPPPAPPAADAPPDPVPEPPAAPTDEEPSQAALAVETVDDPAAAPEPEPEPGAPEGVSEPGPLAAAVAEAPTVQESPAAPPAEEPLPAAPAAETAGGLASEPVPTPEPEPEPGAPEGVSEPGPSTVAVAEASPAEELSAAPPPEKPSADPVTGPHTVLPAEPPAPSRDRPARRWWRVRRRVAAQPKTDSIDETSRPAPTAADAPPDPVPEPPAAPPLSAPVAETIDAPAFEPATVSKPELELELEALEGLSELASPPAEERPLATVHEGLPEPGASVAETDDDASPEPAPTLEPGPEPGIPEGVSEPEPPAAAVAEALPAEESPAAPAAEEPPPAPAGESADDPAPGPTPVSKPEPEPEAPEGLSELAPPPAEDPPAAAVDEGPPQASAAETADDLAPKSAPAPAPEPEPEPGIPEGASEPELSAAAIAEAPPAEEPLAAPVTGPPAVLLAEPPAPSRVRPARRRWRVRRRVAAQQETDWIDETPPPAEAPPDPVPEPPAAPADEEPPAAAVDEAPPQVAPAAETVDDPALTPEAEPAPEASEGVSEPGPSAAAAEAPPVEEPPPAAPAAETANDLAPEPAPALESEPEAGTPEDVSGSEPPAAVAEALPVEGSPAAPAAEEPSLAASAAEAVDESTPALEPELQAGTPEDVSEPGPLAAVVAETAPAAEPSAVPVAGPHGVLVAEPPAPSRDRPARRRWRVRRRVAAQQETDWIDETSPPAPPAADVPPDPVPEPPAALAAEEPSPAVPAAETVDDLASEPASAPEPEPEAGTPEDVSEPGPPVGPVAEAPPAGEPPAAPPVEEPSLAASAAEAVEDLASEPALASELGQEAGVPEDVSDPGPPTAVVAEVPPAAEPPAVPVTGPHGVLVAESPAPSGARPARRRWRVRRRVAAQQETGWIAETPPPAPPAADAPPDPVPEPPAAPAAEEPSPAVPAAETVDDLASGPEPELEAGTPEDVSEPGPPVDAVAEAPPAGEPPAAPAAEEPPLAVPAAETANEPAPGEAPVSKPELEPEAREGLSELAPLPAEEPHAAAVHEGLPDPAASVAETVDGLAPEPAPAPEPEPEPETPEDVSEPEPSAVAVAETPLAEDPPAALPAEEPPAGLADEKPPPAAPAAETADGLAPEPAPAPEPEPGTREGVPQPEPSAAVVAEVPPAEAPPAEAPPAAPAAEPSAALVAEPPAPTRDRPARRRRRVPSLVAAIVVLLAAGGVAVAVSRAHAAHSGHGHATASHRAGSHPSSKAFQLAAAWVAQQVARNAIVACDPLMCSALEAKGMPAANLMILRSDTPSPLGAQVVVVTPAVRSQFGTRLDSVYAPSVIAGFGSGPDQVSVQVIAQDGPAAYLTALHEDMAARKAAGAQLLANKRIGALPEARTQLAAGAVDSRLLITLAALAAQHPIQILAFSQPAPGAAPGVPLCEADLSGSGQAAKMTDAKYLSWLTTFVRAQLVPFAGSMAVLPQAGQSVVQVVFAQPSPLGLLAHA